MKADKFIPFKASIDGYEIPERFTYPFYYEPHPLTLIAANALQEHLKNQADWEHNFGLDQSQDGLVIGKMFGVLVVKNKNGELGYLAAFSGKLADENHHDQFVPPVYDMLQENGFFLTGMKEIDKMSERLETLENNPKLEQLRQNLALVITKANIEVERHREMMREAKKQRKIKRLQAEKELSTDELEVFNKELIKESLHNKQLLKELNTSWQQKIEEAKHALGVLENEITALKKQRKQTSGKLQQQIFDEYNFLNQKGESKSLWDIFQVDAQKVPPSGAGECAAPKLLQYAYLNQLQPIALAEFWWGESPKSEIRKHGNFYPSCRGKCEPILGHMLKGLEVDNNPMLIDPSDGKELTILFEDEVLVVVNKPEEFLSVPGKTIKDCVYQRMLERYPNATGPLIVHRLDMATSGILLIAKTKEANKALQKQFIDKTIRKRYIALLDGNILEEEGMVDLPLRVDLDDRPRQLVCYEHGKEARTKWKVKERRNNQTLVYFYPITGRTHQLRVHAAHQSGLNTAIVGDDLYGKKDARLHLHAEWIQFNHPTTDKVMTFQVDPEF